jgi:CBS domain-containing protein
MSDGTTLTSAPYLRLHAENAADVMTPNPVSMRDELSVHEAIVFLTDRRISAAPVINEAGRPVGVLTEADILRYTREHVEHLHPIPENDYDSELTLSNGEHLDEQSFEVEMPDVTCVRDIMNPVIYSVSRQATVDEVVRQLVRRRIHRLFVVDEDESLVGVITTLDLLRRLRA